MSIHLGHDIHQIGLQRGQHLFRIREPGYPTRVTSGLGAALVTITYGDEHATFMLQVIPGVKVVLRIETAADQANARRRPGFVGVRDGRRAAHDVRSCLYVCDLRAVVPVQLSTPSHERTRVCFITSGSTTKRGGRPDRAASMPESALVAMARKHPSVQHSECV